MGKYFANSYLSHLSARKSFLSRVLSAFVCLCAFSSCHLISHEPLPGPDKQARGTVVGAVAGAGSGAVTGFQMGIGTGQGALVGMALGAVYGTVSGLGLDLLEEDQMRREFETQQLKEIAWAHEALAEHFARRLELYPGRDIFPADLFFDADESVLRPQGALLADRLAELTRQRMPWSRIVIASYVTSKDAESSYARYITRKRADEIARHFVRGGVEPRRVFTKAITLPEPLVVDPNDYPDRYRQAIEIVALDH